MLCKLLCADLIHIDMATAVLSSLEFHLYESSQIINSIKVGGFH